MSHGDGKHCVRHAELSAQLRDLGGFGGAFGAQTVIDRCRFDRARQRLRGEQQQRQTVWTARDREAQLARLAPQRFQVPNEAADQRGIESRHLIWCTSPRCG